MKPLFLIVVVILFMTTIVFAQELKRDALEVNFLDVGQGDAILIEAPEGQNILIDGGDGDVIMRQLGEVLPFWDKKIDLVILTHPHDDHVTGLNSVLKRFDVERVLYTGVQGSSPAYSDFLEIVEEKEIPIFLSDDLRLIDMGEDCDLEIIYPFIDISGQNFDNLNNTSIVSRLNCVGKTFLFTGDIEKKIEEEILDSEINIKSDVLKVAHHGSDTSNTGEFLNSVDPDLVVIQSGEGNKFGHPSLRTIQRLKRQGVEILRNDILGTIELSYE